MLTRFEPLVQPHKIGLQIMRFEPVKTTGFECVRATRIECVQTTRIEPLI